MQGCSWVAPRLGDLGLDPQRGHPGGATVHESIGRNERAGSVCGLRLCGAPGDLDGDNLPVCTNTRPTQLRGRDGEQHGNNTDKTVLPGTGRHAC